MFTTPPWDHIPEWREARADLMDLLALAAEVRAGVLESLTNPHDNAMSQGFVFYVRWRGTLVEMAKSSPHIEVVHYQRGVFSIHGVPIRLYRAEADDDTPERVLEVSRQEQDVQKALVTRKQMAFAFLTPDPAPPPPPVDMLRIRTVPDEDNAIAEFVFEELTAGGTPLWSWSIRAEEVPRALVDTTTHVRQPVEQPAPTVALRLLDTAASNSDDEE